MERDKFKWFFAGALVALASSVGAYAAFNQSPAVAADKNTSHVLLSPEDYIEIEQLYSMYARDVDPGSARPASWMFTKDAVVVMDDFKTMNKPEDIEAFYKWVQKRQSGGGMRHFNSSYVIVGTPDGGARGSSYMLTLETKEKGGKPEVTAFGKYEDKLVKTPDGWRIKERVWRGDTYRADTKPITASPVPGNRATDDTGAAAALVKAGLAK
jgi:hypothetical protein